jgi:hypothetical protein
MIERKKWTAKTEVTPELERFREKRKWQIALRRYVLERNPCTYYAPYFGLDIENMRKWFEIQFGNGLDWSDFGKKWQFDHLVPVTYFDFSDEYELRMCWNFTNLRVEYFKGNKSRRNTPDVLAAKRYFNELYSKTSYVPCLNLLQKIEKIEVSNIVSSGKQELFILENKEYLDTIVGYSTFEFELINLGRSVEDVKNESAFVKRFR